MTAQSPKQKRAIFWILGSVLLILAIAVGIGVYRPGGINPSEQPIPIPTGITVIHRGTLQQKVVASGRVVPNFEVEIKGKASGKILQLPYDVGQTVREGELLVVLDPIDESRQVRQAAASASGAQRRIGQSQYQLQLSEKSLETELSRAKAALAAAQAKEKDADIKAQRLHTLVQKKFISQEEYETGLTTAQQAGAEAQQAQVRFQEIQNQKLDLSSQKMAIAAAAAEAEAQGVALTIAQQRLSETRIYSPITGIVTSRLGQIGQIVSSGISNVGGGTTIMTVADFSKIYVLAAVDESDIGHVQLGQKVSIVVDAFPNKSFTGRVTQIAPKGTVVSNVVTFETKIEVLDPDKHLLKSEMTANANILVQEKKHALIIPPEALQHQGTKTLVYVVQPAPKGNMTDYTKLHLSPQEVHLGMRAAEGVEVLQGLKPGVTLALFSTQGESRWKRNEAESKTRGQRAVMRSWGGRR